LRLENRKKLSLIGASAFFCAGNLTGSATQWMVSKNSTASFAGINGVGVDLISFRDESRGSFAQFSYFDNVNLVECIHSQMTFSAGVHTLKRSGLYFDFCRVSDYNARLELIDSDGTIDFSSISVDYAGVIIRGTNLTFSSSTLDLNFSYLGATDSTIKMTNSSTKIANAGLDLVNSTLDAASSQIVVVNGSVLLLHFRESVWEESNITVTAGSLSLVESALTIGPGSTVQLVSWGKIVVNGSALSIVDSNVSNNAGVEILNGGSVQVSGMIETGNVTQAPGTSSTLSNGTIVSDTYQISENSTLEGFGTLLANVTNSGLVNVSSVINISQYNQTTTGSIYINVMNPQNGTLSGAPNPPGLLRLCIS
jgi:hypothetical protein